MAAILIGITVMAIVMTAAMPVWKHANQREKEDELVFRGEQYVHAIALFQRRYANAYPPSIDVLVEQKFLRKKYKDPITGEDFVVLTQASQQGGIQPGQIGGQAGQRGGAQAAPQTGRGAQTTGRGPAGAASPGVATPGGAPAGGIIGVTSKSTDTSIRLYKGRSHYNEWAFVYTAPVQNPGAAVPGQRGRDGQPPAPGGGFGRGRGGRDGGPGGGGRSFDGPNGPNRGNFPPFNPGQGQPPGFPGPPGRGR